MDYPLSMHTITEDGPAPPPEVLSANNLRTHEEELRRQELETLQKSLADKAREVEEARIKVEQKNEALRQQQLKLDAERAAERESRKRV